MWRDKGRSGIGNQVFEPDNGNPIGTWEDQSGLSPNGRQWHNKLTGEQRDLSGANYWHQRKELYPRFGHIEIGDYKTPSYYHQKKPDSKKVNEVEIPVFEKVECSVDENVKTVIKKHKLSDDNYFLRLYNWYQKIKTELKKGL